MMIAFVAGLGAGIVITCAYLIVTEPPAVGGAPGPNPRGPRAHRG